MYAHRWSPLFALLLSLPALDTARAATFVAQLSGGDVAPPRKSDAHGIAVFRTADGGLTYRLMVMNMDNVVGAEIRLGAPGENGPEVATLFGPAAPHSGRAPVQLARATLTRSALRGPLAGRSIDDLIAAFRSGRAYVNVRTDDGLDPRDSGPGDFPSGELRGQIGVKTDAP